MRAANSNGEETEKAISDAAVKVIAKHGFQAASLREIAKEVGIRAPSLYNYIKSKEKLLYDLLKVPVSAMIADYKAMTEGVSDPRERLQVFVKVHLDFHLNHRLEVFIGNMELRSLSTPHYRVITGLREEYGSLLQKIIEDGAKAGVFEAPRPRVATLVMLGMLSSVCNWYQPGGAMSAEEMTKLHTELAFRMLGAEMPLGETKAARAGRQGRERAASGLAVELREIPGHHRAGARPRVAVVQEEGRSTIGRPRRPELRHVLLAVGRDRLEGRGGQGIEQLAHARAAPRPADGRIHGPSPARADARAGEFRHPRHRTCTEGEGQGRGGGMRLANDHVVVDRDARQHVVHRRAGRQRPALPVGIHVGLLVEQLALDIPQAVLAKETLGHHSAPVDEAPRRRRRQR